MLSPEQQLAVESTNQDVCVVAGPGSGKTRVLIERFAWLVEFHNVNPARILAITFTEKAATEIKERLIARFAHSPEHRESIERAWVSTIDGFCARLLQENAVAANIAPDFAVLEQPQAVRLQRESAEESLDQLFRENPRDMRRLMEALDLSTDDLGRKQDLAASILEVYETMRVSGVDELPPQIPSPDIWPEARRLAQSILDDPSAGASHTSQLREWARRFLALPDLPATRLHFELAGGLDANLGRIGKGQAARAAKTLKQEVLPALESHFIETRNADLLYLLREAVTRLDQTYRKKKRDLSALDFGDLEEDSIRLLESDYAIRDSTRARFDQILMDELQDTNRLQWRLLNLIRSSEEFFAVGDINQSIYGFRHADPSVFEEYRASGAAVHDLLDNYRSRPQILEAVSRVLDDQQGIEPRKLSAAKTFSEATGPIVERLVAEGDDVEASLVAARIADFAPEYKGIAILVRSLNALDPFTRALDRFGIPFITSGGRTFLEAREIRDLMAFLAALVNPLDEIALVGVLRSPIVNLSDQEILRLGREGWQQVFHSRFGRLRKLAGFISPDRLLPEQPYLSPRARANVDKLRSWLRREHRGRPRPLAEILDDLEFLRANPSEAEAPPPEAGNVVQLMSIHAAKGLEFRIVFVSALHRGADKSSPVIVFSHGIGAKWRNPASGESQPDSAYAALSKERKLRESAEENRLLYVAMTRAEERLYLTYTKGRSARGWQKLVEPVITAETFANEIVPAALKTKTAEIPDVQIAEKPRVSDQHDSTAAVTAVALFAACPRKYFLSEYIGFDPEPDEPGTGAISLGSEVHKILAGENVISVEGQALVDRFRASEFGQRAARASRIEREFDFLLAMEDVVLRGKIDLWFEEDGELILVDYKTDRVESPETYALQLQLYALAIERYVGRIPDRAVLYYLRSDRAVEIDVGLNGQNHAKMTVKQLLNAQKTMMFPLQEGEHCFRCEFYKGLCPAGKT